ncbi:MAG: hypothetical protein QNJ30_22390 [Kiloniellales bacterium]|nr:hypothetical protein [Kiloniellales bacterium]
MPRRGLLFVALLLAAACAVPESEPEMTVSADLVGAPVPAVRVLVEAVPKGRPIERIILAGPDGTTVEAERPPLAIGKARDSRSVTARIPLPDPAGYRASPEGWIVIIVTRNLRGRTISYQFPAPRP